MIASVAGMLLAVVTLAGSAAAAPAGPARIQACDRLTIQLDDPTQGEFGPGLADAACRQRRRLEALFHARLPRLVVRVARDGRAFRRLTGRRWFMAAALAGDQLILQPVVTLKRVGDTEALVAHELIHALVRARAGPGCPRWLDEGLAQELSGQAGGAQPLSGPPDLAALQARLEADDPNRAARGRDYAAARWVVRRLISRIGTRALLGSLRTICQAPDPLQVQVAERSLGAILFADPAIQVGTPPGP